MDPKSPSRARQSVRGEHVEATAFLYVIVETADHLRSARDFDGSPALRFDARWALLRSIEQCGGCPSFSDVARMLRVRRQSARALIVAAEKAGVVEVFPDPYDRRAFQVALTTSGRRTFENHRLPDMTWIFTLLNGLEPKAMQSTAHVLRVIGQRLERHEKERRGRPRNYW